MKRSFITVTLLLAASVWIHADEPPPAGMELLRTIPLPNVTGRIDHMSADVPNQRLFIAALGNNSVEVVDVLANKWIKSLGDLPEPQGIAYAPQVNKLFVANAGDGSCVVFDGEKLTRVGKIDLGKDADNLRYDAGSKR